MASKVLIDFLFIKFVSILYFNFEKLFTFTHTENWNSIRLFFSKKYFDRMGSMKNT